MSEIRVGGADQPARVPEAVAALGATPRERLEWLLDNVVYADGDDIRPRTARRLWFSLHLLVALAGENPRIVPLIGASDSLRAIQKQVGDALETLVARRPYKRSFNFRSEFEFKEPKRFHRGKALVLRQSIETSFVDAVLLVALELARAIPLTLLRPCEYKKKDTARPCGHVFVGKKRQVCCAKHRRMRRQEQNREAQKNFRLGGGRKRDAERVPE